MERELTLRDIGQILRKSWIFLTVLMLCGALAAYGISAYVLEKKYEANAMMIVSVSVSASSDPSVASMTVADYTLNTKLVNSYSILCKSERVLNQVKEKLNIDMSIKDISEMIKVTSKSDTDIINITVSDTSPQLAQSIANTLVDVFKDEVSEIMKMDNVQVIDYATVPTEAVSPNVKNNILIGLAVGLLIALAIVVLKFLLDDSIKDDDLITEITGAPVIGSIPRFE